MGFTEAELGFALAAFFVAVGVGFLQQKAEAEVHTRDIIAENEQLRAENKQLRAENERLRALSDSLQKKSNLTPPCSEKGEPKTPIARLRILDAERYGFEMEELDFDGVQARLATQIARSKTKGCRYNVEVVAMSGVDAPQHSRATGRLKSLFYVSEVRE
jgi:hypothetical protein